MVTVTEPIAVVSSTIGTEASPSVTPEEPLPLPSAAPIVTPAPAPSVTPPPAPAPSVTPPPPAPVVTPAPVPGGNGIVISQGAVAPACTHSVCHYVHITWQGLAPGAHDTQCVTDHDSLGAWSHGNYNFPSASGEMDLGCFLGYPGSHVWVILDGSLESAHIDW